MAVGSGATITKPGSGSTNMRKNGTSTDTAAVKTGTATAAAAATAGVGTSTRKSSVPTPKPTPQIHHREFWTLHHLKMSWRMIEFKYLKLTQFLCTVYIVTVSFAPAGSLGVFGGARTPGVGIVDTASPENTSNGIIVYDNLGRTVTRAIVADGVGQMLLLAVSRFCAFFMYPCIVFVFFSKYRALHSCLDKTPLGVFLISDTHVLHVYCGWVIFICGCVHSIFHLIRYGVQGNLYLVFGHRSGISGITVWISLFFIVLPMGLKWFKKTTKYEVRKYIHYLFWIFAIAMCFHAPFWALPTAGFCGFIFPTLMIVYILDASYVKLFMSERITTVSYETCSSGVQLTMPVSERFRKALHAGGYVYVMAEWLSIHEWHAFSLYENPNNPSERRIFLAKLGDWTTKVYDKTADRNTSRPVWLSGPFPSPYNSAMEFDNLICVAAGIGITPALSTIEAFRESRRVSLIWAVRDATMLVFFLKSAKLDPKGFNLVFYTGNEPLPDSIENYNGNVNLTIIRERPNLAHIIPNIIQDIDKYGHSRAEAELPDPDMVALAMLQAENKRLLAENTTDVDGKMGTQERAAKLAAYTEYVLGYNLTQLVNEIPYLPTIDNDGTNVTEDPDATAEGLLQRIDNFDLKATGISESLDPTHSVWTTGRSAVTRHNVGSGGGTVHENHEQKPLLDENDEEADTETNLEERLVPPSSSSATVGASSCGVSFSNRALSRRGITRYASRLTHSQGQDQYDEEAGSAPNNPIWKEDLSARPYVHAMADKNLETWAFFYCGGRNPLLEALVEESNDLNIPLHQEAFDW